MAIAVSRMNETSFGVIYVSGHFIIHRSKSLRTGNIYDILAKILVE